MNEFMLLFRRDLKTQDEQPSPEQMQAAVKLWQDWVGNIAAQNKLVRPGNRLDTDGRVVKPRNVVTDGPYAEIKESIAGYAIIKAKDYNEAVAIAKDCPILQWGGNVEVRKFIAEAI